jgi:RelA/SpoT family (p)ppGpp synthetase
MDSIKRNCRKSTSTEDDCIRSFSHCRIDSRDCCDETSCAKQRKYKPHCRHLVRLLLTFPTILYAFAPPLRASREVYSRAANIRIRDDSLPNYSFSRLYYTSIPPRTYPALEEDVPSTKNGSSGGSSGAGNGISKGILQRSLDLGGRANIFSTGRALEEVKVGEKHTTATSSATNTAATATASGNVDEETQTAPEVNHWTEIMSRGFSEHARANTTAWDTVLSDWDLEQIESYWDRIMPTVSYLGTERVAQVYQALCVAYRAHRGQFRKSGEPFIVHPVEVSLLLSGLKMDAETVMAGLLHDTVEDTDMTFAQVQSLFGPTVRGIVEGETKVSKLPKLAFTDYADEQAENLRQMFVAMTDDYRIIIVKLADRLHNMRTLRHMKPEKQIKISRETLDIFAPLAHRMGIWQFKSELEDTAFMYLYPSEYKRLNRCLRQHQTKYRETLENAQAILQRQINMDQTLQQQAAKVEVFGRTKEIYSLWHKMETKQEHNLDHIVDVVALRVIITPRESKRDIDDGSNGADRGVWLCYHVLGLVQHLPGFVPMPTRVKDYISFPKPNGYQSLHTAIILNGQTIEVQIRTSMMHQVAEFGMASHWAYTDDKRRGSVEALYNTPWLSSIKEWQNDKISSRDFVDSVRRELLGKRVFVFLRNGKILNLARGATVIDAAFQIHTEVGLKMHGVEINGKPVPLSYELRNGDVVSILTGKGKPATDWMRYAKSRSTRSKLRAYFRAKQKESLREAGKILLMDYLLTHAHIIKKESYVKETFKMPSTPEELEKFLPNKTRYTDVDELLISIGRSHDRQLLHTVVSQIFEVPKRLLMEAEDSKRGPASRSIIDAIAKKQTALGQSNLSTTGLKLTKTQNQNTTTEPLFSQYSIDKMLSGLDVGSEYADIEHLCKECLPIYGDEIVGTRVFNKDTATTVHRVGCHHAQRAINNAVSLQQKRSAADAMTTSFTVPGTSIPGADARVDSVTLRQQQGYVWNRASPKKHEPAIDSPVRLRWSDWDEAGNFLAEVVIHSEDRKLVLADCTKVVSRMAQVMKTNSAASKGDPSTLAFLVRVEGLEHLQELLDKLSKIDNVLSVERRFGASLL